MTPRALSFRCKLASLPAPAGEGGTAAFAAMTDLEGERFRLMRKNNYRNGRATVERILEVLDARGEPSIAEVARVRIALGDWHMWWNSPALATANYREAWHLYSEDDDPGTSDPCWKMAMRLRPGISSAPSVFATECPGTAAALVRVRYHQGPDCSTGDTNFAVDRTHSCYAPGAERGGEGAPRSHH